jgi:hypothetical protein
MGERPHYFLELMGTIDENKRKGAASMLLQWGCDQADREGLECYVDASPDGLPLYERFGWEKKGEQDMPGGFGYTEVFLVRPPKVPSVELVVRG